jgi:hypothetical protein
MSCVCVHRPTRTYLPLGSARGVLLACVSGRRETKSVAKFRFCRTNYCTIYSYYFGGAPPSESPCTVCTGRGCPRKFVILARSRIPAILFYYWGPLVDRPWRPLGLREVEAPTFSDIRLTDGCKVVSLARRPPFNRPGRYLVLIYVRGCVDLRAIMLLEGLGKLKKIQLIRDSKRRPSSL